MVCITGEEKPLPKYAMDDTFSVSQSEFGAPPRLPWTFGQVQWRHPEVPFTYVDATEMCND